MWQRYKVVLVFSSDCLGSSSGVCCDSLLSSAALQSSNCCTVLISSFVKASPSSLSSAEACSSQPLIHSSSFCSSCSSLISEGPGSSWHRTGVQSCCFRGISSGDGGAVGCLASARMETEMDYTWSTHQSHQRQNSAPRPSGLLPLR